MTDDAHAEAPVDDEPSVADEIPSVEAAEEVPSVEIEAES